MNQKGIVAALERIIFGHRPLVIVFFVLVTIFMGYVAATRLTIDAGFSKQLPLKHEYMQTFQKHFREFGGADRVLVALIAKDGDMFDPAFFEALQKATNQVFLEVPGVDRARVSSLFTPGTRYIEVVEDGIQAGPVIPPEFAGNQDDLDTVRENILKSGVLGRLVANDFSGAIISANLLEVDPETGERLDYFAVAERLEAQVREVIASDEIDVHIIGFARVMGDIRDGALRVVLFFGIALLTTTLLVFMFCQSFRIAVVPLVCSLVAVVWQLGLLPLLGFGIDPMGLLVPFLVFAIGVSHGVQMVASVRGEIFEGADPETAARTSFRRLAIPGGIALASDTIGFVTILFIEIAIIQEMAITASLGVAAIILTNLVLLPVLISYLKLAKGYRERMQARLEALFAFWQRLSGVAERKNATVIVLIAAGLAAYGMYQGSQIRIGDLHAGVPELRPDSRYNMDTEVITTKFSIGVDIISVIVETIPDGCIDYDVMQAKDDFAWHMRNVPGVQEVVTLSTFAKIVRAGWNEGSMKWRVLSRNPQNMVQATQSIETSSGLLNRDCSVMPVMIFTEDHKAETIDRVINAVKGYRDANPDEKVTFQLATGNVGVMAASNEEVSRSQFPILMGVFGAIILLCWLTFRSFKAVLCIVVPLALVSVLAYALMTHLLIGLKVNTLPVVALGVGIGVDYGIYIYSRLQQYLKQGDPLRTAYMKALAVTGSGVVFTGVTLAIGVFTWIFSPLKFQADMGILLTFMFLVNMLGAILLLPALAAWLLPKHAKPQEQTA